jgi:hypothetical protein
MKIYTFYTQSHIELLKIFLENFPQNDDIDLVVRKLPQECYEASYLTNGWNLTMKRKVEYIIHSLNETPENEWFVHSDCDIVLFSGWEDILQKYKNDFDMMNQNDFSVLCAGFFFCKNNDRTRELWNKVLENLDSFEHDQWAMNAWIKKIPNLKVGILPNTYFTYGLLGRNNWSGEEFTIPNIENLKMFHANWTQGVENKMKLMKEVIKQKYV